MRGAGIGKMALGLVLLGGSSCLLEPSDDLAHITLLVPIDGPLPRPGDGALRDATGKVDLDVAGFHLQVVAEGGDLEEPWLAELLPGSGSVSDSRLALEIDLPAGEGIELSVVLYLRKGEPGAKRTDAGARAFTGQPVVQDLIEGERVEIELPLSLLATGSVAGEVVRPIDVIRPDVTHVALVDQGSDTLLPHLEVQVTDTAEGRFFSFSIPGVPVNRTYALRLYFLDGTVQDLDEQPANGPDPRITLQRAGDSEWRKVNLEQPE